MCRICYGNPPTLLSFNKFRGQVLKARQNITNPTRFINEAINMDRLRFTTGDEWGEPHTCQDVTRYIFGNPNPDEGLVLLTLSCWLDMRAPYTTVWSTYLRQAKNWINGNGTIPRGNYRPVAPHLLLTMRTVQSHGSISRWFIHTINNIIQNHGQSSGNLYRFAGEVCNALYSKSKVVSSLRSGSLPTNFSGGDHKRFWMFMMFLRRDNSVIRCLFTRALGRFPNGQEAIQYWYDPTYFNPFECELPVDRRVLANWNNVLRRMGIHNLLSENPSQVARQARAIARRYNISPSVFDAILFF